METPLRRSRRVQRAPQRWIEENEEMYNDVGNASEGMESEDEDRVREDEESSSEGEEETSNEWHLEDADDEGIVS